MDWNNPMIVWLVGGGVLTMTLGWIITTWVKAKHGYPLENAWGESVYPKSGDAAMERIKLLSTENAQLKAEIGALKDRMANVERIVTDEGRRLEHEIEALRLTRN